MMTQERPPALGRHVLAWRSTEMPGRVLADRARRDLQAELEPQFVGNTPLTPGEIVARHLPDEPLQLHRDWGPSGLGFPEPPQTTSLATPAGKSLGLNDGQGWLPVEPAGQSDQGEARSVSRTLGFDVARLVERQLFAQKEILSGECRRGAQPEPENTDGINAKREEHVCQLIQMAHQARAT